MSIHSLLMRFSVSGPSKLLPSFVLNNPGAYGDNFGYSVAISGNYFIVGAPYADSSGLDSGKAYIFDASTGSLLHTLTNPNAYGTYASDLFGWAVSIDGSSAVVSAVREDDSGGTDSGKVYVFDVTTGTRTLTLNNPNTYGTAASDWFGRSVAISGNYVVVGAFREDDSGGTDSGKAYIFDATTGSLLRTLNNPNTYGTAASDWFGHAVAISGNYVVVSAYQEDDAGGTQSGKVYVFDVTTGSLLHTLNNPNGTSANNYFGASVAIDGTSVLVGAYGTPDAGGATSGKVYIFDASTGSLLHTLNNPNAQGTSAGDSFGASVAIAGNYAVAGAHGEDESISDQSSGKAYIFDVTTGSLLHILDNPNAYGTAANDYFGQAVAIHGNRVLVGAYGEDDAGGVDSGKAYIYQF